MLIFSKSYCPYCSEAKDLLKKLNYAFKVYELNVMKKGAEI